MKRNFPIVFIFTVFILVLSNLSVAQTVPSYVPTSGLIAWYPFTGNAVDSSGNGNNGVMLGAATYGVDRFGNASSCYVGNGSSGVNIPTPNFPVGNNARSVSVWFKLPIPFPGGERELMAWGNNAALGQRFGIHANDSILGLEYRNAFVALYSSYDSAWHNLTITYSGSGGSSSVLLYLDGYVQTSYVSGAVTSFNTDTGSIHTIGTLFLPTANTYSWVGSLDDIGVWNRALTPCEIYKLYYGTSNVTPSLTISANTSNYITPGSSVTFTAVSVNGGANPSYQWKLNGSNVGTNSGTYTSSSLNNGDTVSCILTSSAPCSPSSTATSNSIHIIIPSLSGTSACPGSVLTLSSTINPLQIVWKQNGTVVHTTNASWNASATTVAGGNGSGSSANQLYYPGDVFIDSVGNLYVTDVYNNRVQKWAPGATSGTTIAGGNGQGSAANQFYHPSGIAVDKNGNIYVGDQLNNRVQKWAPGATSGTTVAGGNGQGSGANQFNQVMGIWLDNGGNLYVCDMSNNRVQKWAPGASSGTTVAGGNGAGSGSSQLNSPWELFLDLSGNIYISDFNNHRVQKWAPGASSGTTVAGGNGAGSGSNQLNSPSGIYIDGNGNMYIANIGSASIKKWALGASSGTVIAGGNGAGSASNQLSQPWGILLDSNGNIYVGDQYNNRVQKFSVNDTMTYTAPSAGSYTATVTTFWGTTATTAAYTINAAVTPGIVISTSPSAVVTQGTSVTFSATITNGGSSPSYQWKINGINVASTTSSYTTATLNNGDSVTCVLTSNANCASPAIVSSNYIIMTVNSTPVVLLSSSSVCVGSVLTLVSSLNPLQIVWNLNGSSVHTVNANWIQNATTVAGGNGSGNGTNQLNQPRGIYIDKNNNVYIGDAANHRVQKWAPGANSAITVAGGNGSGSAANQLSFPAGVFVDRNGNLYIVDASNNRIQKWTPGAISGTTVAGGNGSGTGANQFSNPMAVFVDYSGNIFVGDNGNNRVQKWVPGATTGITVAGGNGAGSSANQFNGIFSIFVNGNDNVYVADLNNNRIQEWAPGASTGVTVAGNQVYSPTGIYVDANASMYIACTGQSRILKWVPNATSPAVIAGGNGTGSASNQLNAPWGICLDSNGNIFVGDNGNNRVQKFSVNDTMTYTTTAPGSYTATVITFGGASATTASSAINTSYTPSVVISANSGNVITFGATVTFTAVPTYGGTNPTYQWKVNGNNVGTNSSTFSSSSLGNNDVVSCALTSNLSCANPATATSNTINIVIPAVSLSGTSHCPGSVLTVGSSINPLQIIWSLNGSPVQTTNAVWNSNATTVAGQSSGTSGSGAAYLNMGGGGGVYADTGGTVYVADYNNNRIEKWPPGATSGTLIAGGNGAGSATNQISGPSGVYVDAAGNVYVADAGNNRIMKWAPAASYGVLVAGGNGSGSGANQLHAPQNVKVDDSGNVYIPDGSNNRVQKWAPGASTGVTVAGQSNGNGGSGLNQLNNPEDVFIDASGNVYVADGGNHRIMKWPPGASSGTLVAAGNGAGSGANQLNGPTGVYVDYFNNIYISDGGNNRIQKWVSGASSGTTIGGGNGAGTNANQLHNPIDLYFDASGDMYVADGSNNRIQEFTYSTSSLNYTANSIGAYTATVTTFAGASSTSSSWTIYPTPTLTSTTTPPAICNNTVFSYQPLSSISGTTFNWSRAAVSGISNAAANGTGNPNETLVNTTSNPVTVTYVYSLSASGCTNPTNYNITETVYPTPLLSSSSTSSSVCNNTTINISLSSATSGTTFTWNRSGVSGISNPTASGAGNPNETLVNTSANPLTVIYVYTLSANGCTNPTNYNVTVTVNPTPVLSSALSVPAICNNNVFNYYPTSSTFGAGFTWSRATVSGISNSAATGYGNPAETLVNTSTNQVIVTYAYTVSINGCTNPNAFNVTETVNPTPVLSNNSTTFSICSNSNFSFTPTSLVSGTTFAWSRAVVSGISNSAATGTGNPNETLINTTGSSVTVTYVYSLSANGCTNTQNVNVTLSPIPVLTSTLTPASICSYGTFTYTPGSATSGTTFTWTRPAVAGISNTANSGTGYISETLIDTTHFAVPATYIFTLSANGCTNPVNYYVVDTVNVSPYITTQPLNRTLCVGDSTTFAVSASGSGIIYQWKVNTGSGFTALSNGGNYSGTTSPVLSVNGVTAGMNNYQYQCTISGTCVPAVLTSIATLSVNAPPSITAFPSGNIVCVGANATYSVTATGGGLSYQWYVNQGSGFSAISNGTVYSGATTNTLSINGVTTAMNAYQYQCIISGTCSPEATTPAVLLFVNTLPAISSQPQTISVCAGNDTSFSVSATGTNLSYQWQLNTGGGFNNLSNNSTYSGVTGSSLHITNALASMSGYLYRCVISGACTPQAISSAATLTVNTAPSFAVQPYNTTVCTGDSANFVSLAASGVGISYQWQINTGTGFANLQNNSVYSGSTAFKLHVVNSTNAMNGYQYRCIVSGVCSPVAISDTVTLTVNLLPSISVQDTNAVVCAGADTSFSISANGTALSYQWKVDTGSGFITVYNTGIYSNATSNTLTLTSVPAGMNGYHYKCIVSGACSPNDTSNTVLLSVNIAPVIVSQVLNDTVCEGSNTTFSITATGSALTYQWQLNTGSGYANLNNTGIYSGATTNVLTLSNIPVSISTYQYRCVVSGACTPFVNSNGATIIVNSLPLIGTQAISSTICAGANTSFSVSASGTSIAYQWQVNTGSGFTNLSNSSTYSGVTTSSLSIQAAPAAMDGYMYRCLVNGVCLPQAISNTVTLNVNTAPSISQQPLNSTICNGTNTGFSVSASGSALTYQWQVNSGAGFINLSNTGVYSGATTNALQISVAPDSITGYRYRCLVSGTCNPSLISNTDTLIVHDSLAITAQPVNTNTICSGGNTSFSVGVSGTLQSYQWQVNTGTGFVNVLNGGVYNGASTDSLTLTGASTTMNGFQFRCIASGPCTPSLISNTASFIVNPLPQASVTAGGPLIFCPYDSVGLTANSGSGLSYQWQLNSVNIPGAINGFYETSAPGNYSVIVTNSYNCAVASSSLSVANYPAPSAVITPSGPTTFCSNDSVILQVASGPGLSYQWLHNGINIYNATNSSFTTNISGSYTVVVTNSNNCVTTSSATNITVNFVPIPPLYTVMGYLTFCNGDSLLLGTNANYLGYQWQQNGLDIPGATSNQYMIHSAGVYRVIISVPLCSAASSSDSVVVNPLPVDSLIFSLPAIICSSIDSYVISAFQAPGQSYQWYKNGLIIYGATSAQYIATVPDGYNVEISSAQGCSLFTQSVNIGYVVSPVPVITLQGNLLHTGLYNSYQWYLNNVSIPGATVQDYTVLQNGSYTVSVTDTNGCPGMSSPYLIHTLGITHVSTSADDIRIYPNPASSIVYFEAQGIINVSVSDLQGKILLQKDNAKSIDISELANGVYMIRVYDETNTILKTEKLVKNSW